MGNTTSRMVQYHHCRRLNWQVLKNDSESTSVRCGLSLVKIVPMLANKFRKKLLFSEEMYMAWSVAPILGSNHVVNSVNYYCEKLGFQAPDGVFMPEGHDQSGVYAIVQRDGISLHLQIRRRSIFPEHRERIESEVYLYVEDVDPLFAEFSNSGAKILRGITDGPSYDLRDFVVQDPDGNRLIFGSPILS